MYTYGRHRDDKVAVLKSDYVYLATLLVESLTGKFNPGTAEIHIHSFVYAQETNFSRK